MSDAEFEWLRLQDDETVTWSGQPKLIGSAGSLILGALMVPFLGLGLVVLAALYLRVQHTEYVVTTDRAVKKTGIVSRTVTDLGHDKIQDTSYQQSALGKHYGFGDVDISTAGGSGVELRFADVEDPLSVQERLDEAARGAETGPSASGAGTPAGDSRGGQLDEATIAQLCDDLRGTREALESIERQLDDRRD